MSFYENARATMRPFFEQAQADGEVRPGIELDDFIVEQPGKNEVRCILAHALEQLRAEVRAEQANPEQDRQSETDRKDRNGSGGAGRTDAADCPARRCRTARPARPRR